MLLMMAKLKQGSKSSESRLKVWHELRSEAVKDLNS